MADAPTKPVSVNVGVYYVIFESNSENPDAGQIIGVEKDGELLDPTGSEFLTVVNDTTTQTALVTALKNINIRLYRQLFEQ
mgnify:CR=1 FL=1